MGGGRGERCDSKVRELAGCNACAAAMDINAKYWAEAAAAEAEAEAAEAEAAAASSLDGASAAG